MRLLTFLLLPVLAGAAARGAAPERHVVVITWDGMRPDFISEQNTPHLWALRQRGVFFAHHHPVYISATEVNGTAIATGAYPADSHIIANTDYRPAIDPLKPVGMEVPATVRKGDEVSGGHYLARPTVAEILHQHHLATAIAGSKQVALLHDRGRREAGPGVSPIVYEGAVLPESLTGELTATAGNFPAVAKDDNKRDRDAWTTRVLLEDLWRDGVPAYSLLWLAEPDASQHAHGPGSPEALAAIRSSDTNLGKVVAELTRRRLLDQTDILVVSDHGFSTITRKVDVAAELRRAGLDAVRKTKGQLSRGQIMAVSNGGSTLLYVGGHDADTTRRLVQTLQTTEWAGVVLSREAVPGTFPLSAVHLDSPEAPDVVVALRWSRAVSPFGAPGELTSDLAPDSKKMGNHASLSAYDLHNTLVAAGPDFRHGVTDTLPSANTDVAPTILWCLGLPEAAAHMDGRPLSEALNIQAPPLRSYHLERLHAEATTTAGTWQQYLQIAEVNGVRYLDEGNGALAK